MLLRSVRVVLQSMRLPFLLLTPVCVLLGASVASTVQVEWSTPWLWLALAGALLAHISVNTLNEYFDFTSGLDLATSRTAFSGGSGALPQQPDRAKAVFATGVIALLATLLIGLLFVWRYGFGIAPLGLAGVLLVVAYTGWINKHPWLCLIAPGLGFGVLMVVGVQYVLQGEYTLLPWLAGLAPFFLVNNLLLLNQYPDIEADAAAARYHFPIAYGVRRSNQIYALFLLAAAISIIACVVLGYFPLLSLIALLPLPLGLYALSGAVRHGERIGDHPHYLAANVLVALLTPLLLSLSLLAN